MGSFQGPTRVLCRFDTGGVGCSGFFRVFLFKAEDALRISI